MSLVLAVPAVVHGGDAPDDPVSGPSVVTVRSLPTVVVEGARIQSPGLSPSGTNDYMITSQDISNLPGGENTVLTDVLSQLPGVGIDQNQQVHIRNTEGSGYQYQINGVLIPLDIITNPPFISMINPLFIKQLDLVDGILPSRYSYSTGGVVDIQSKDGCDAPGGSATLYGGQRATIQPSAQYSGCSGNFGYYGSALYSQNDEAFSSATPGPSAIHDRTHQGQTFNALSYSLDEHTRLNVILSAAASDNQLPNVPGLAPQYTLAGAAVIPSAQINSYLNFRDYLGLFSLRGSPVPELLYQVSYTAHSISQRYEPDDAGELLYQGVASRASHHDVDNALQGDLTFKTGGHALGAGFYLGIYDVTANSSSLVFPVDVTGTQTSSVPLSVVNDAHAANLLSGVYVNDLWQLDPAWRANIGLRRDGLTGFSPGNQVSPTFNLTYMPYAGTTIHGGVARYFQVPSFEGISPRAPGSFAGTTGAGPDGVTTPQYESDWEWDVGWVQTLAPGLTASVDNFYERTRHYLDAGSSASSPSSRRSTMSMATSGVGVGARLPGEHGKCLRQPDGWAKS